MQKKIWKIPNHERNTAKYGASSKCPALTCHPGNKMRSHTNGVHICVSFCISNLRDTVGYCMILPETFFVFFPWNVNCTEQSETTQPQQYLRLPCCCAFGNKSGKYPITTERDIYVAKTWCLPQMPSCNAPFGRRQAMYNFFADFSCLHDNTTATAWHSEEQWGNEPNCVSLDIQSRLSIAMPLAQSTLDTRTQIRTQILWCCLNLVWTLPFTSTDPICLRLRLRVQCVWIGPEVVSACVGPNQTGGRHFVCKSFDVCVCVVWTLPFTTAVSVCWQRIRASNVDRDFVLCETFGQKSKSVFCHLK